MPRPSPEVWDGSVQRHQDSACVRLCTIASDSCRVRDRPDVDACTVHLVSRLAACSCLQFEWHRDHDASKRRVIVLQPLARMASWRRRPFEPLPALTSGTSASGDVHWSRGLSSESLAVPVAPSVQLPSGTLWLSHLSVGIPCCACQLRNRKASRGTYIAGLRSVVASSRTACGNARASVFASRLLRTCSGLGCSASVWNATSFFV